MKMKRTIVSVMVLVLGMTMLAGCGGSKAGSDGSSFGIDFASTETQQMSDKRAAKEKLSETKSEWLKDATMFLEGSEESKRTYQDFVSYIGCDATEYKFDDSRNERYYTWIAEGEDNCKLGVWFEEKGGKWTLSCTGSTNL